MPILEDYLGDNSLFISAIDLTWKFATDDAFDESEADSILKKCEDLVAELYEADETGATLHAANAAIFALRSTRVPESTQTITAMSEAQGAADCDMGAEGDPQIQEEAAWQIGALEITLRNDEPTREMFRSIDIEPAWLRTFRLRQAQG
jgi:hypothetical protein